MFDHNYQFSERCHTFVISVLLFGVVSMTSLSAIAGDPVPGIDPPPPPGKVKPTIPTTGPTNPAKAKAQDGGDDQKPQGNVIKDPFKGGATTWQGSKQKESSGGDTPQGGGDPLKGLNIKKYPKPTP